MPEDVNVYVFPGGKKRTITIPATAGNADYTPSPGAGFRWIVLYGIVTLVCDGNAANRRVTIRLVNAANAQLGLALKNITNITAGQTRAVPFVNKDIGDINDEFESEDVAGHIFFTYAIVEGTDKIRFRINSGVAGDSYSGFLTVLEMKL